MSISTTTQPRTPHLASAVDLIPAFLKAAYAHTEYNPRRIDTQDIPNLLRSEDITRPDIAPFDLIEPYNNLLNRFGDYVASNLEVMTCFDGLTREGAESFIRAHGRLRYYLGGQFDKAKAALMAYPKENATADICLTWRLASLGHQISTGRTPDKGAHAWLRGQPSARGNQEGLMDELGILVRQRLREITELRSALLEHP